MMKRTKEGNKVDQENEVRSVLIEKKYDARKWKKIMDTTQSNYANMIKRLDRRNKVSNYVLIYYSIFLIAITLTGKYFPKYFSTILGEYFGILLSIIMLAYSLVNNSANYSVRISKIEEALNKLKTIKREVNDENIDTYKEKYYAITDTTERREDVDFFVTVKHLCKEYNINVITKKSKDKDHIGLDEQEKVVNDYVSEINIYLEESKIIFEYLWYGLLFFTPMLIFALCFIVKIRGGV